MSRPLTPPTAPAEPETPWEDPREVCPGCSSRLGDASEDAPEDAEEGVAPCSPRGRRGCSYCTVCCDEHFICDDCGDTRDMDCRCEACDGNVVCQGCCCDHSTCSNCGNRVDSTCEDDECNNCCSGHSSSGIDFRDSKGTVHVGAATDENPTTRLISCEIETHGGGDHRVNVVCDRWDTAVVEDGSIDGVELNTAPASGDKFTNQLRDLCTALNVSAATVHESCGLHVHVNAQDMTWTGMRRLLLVWAHIEPAVFATIPKDRRSNNYCRPIAQTVRRYLTPNDRKNEIKARIIAVRDGFMPTSSDLTRGTHGITTPVRRSSQKRDKNDVNGNRYQAMNIVAWWVHGTVEFRLHSGTVDFVKIHNWSITLANLVERCKNMTDADVAGILAMEPMDAWKGFAPTDAARKWIQWRVKKFA
jgi:hypothetical protein